MVFENIKLENKEKFDNFVKDNKLPIVKTINGYKYKYNCTKLEIDHQLKRILDDQLRLIANNGDLIIGVTGMEGAGKSLGLTGTCASYIAHKLGTKLSIDNVVFTPGQFDKLLTYIKETGIKGVIVWWDEFAFGGLSDDATSAMQKVLIKHFMTMRNQNVICFLVMPTIFMMRAYFATHRTRFLLHAISYDGIKRGNAIVYGYNKKNFLYNMGRKYKSYQGFKFDYRIRFMDTMSEDINEVPLFDPKVYNAKKDKAMEEAEKEKEDSKKTEKNKKQALRESVILNYVLNNYNPTIKELTDATGIPPSTLRGIRDVVKRTATAENSIGNNIDE